MPYRFWGLLDSCLAAMAGQASLVEVDLPTATALEAERIVEQLQLHRAPTRSASATHSQSAYKPKPKAVPETDMQAVDVNSLGWMRPRSVAVEPIGLWTMRQVSFVELLIESGISGPLRAAILEVIIGRMAPLGSELAACRWLGQQSAGRNTGHRFWSPTADDAVSRVGCPVEAPGRH